MNLQCVAQMSVITELFENYDHIPQEFRRQLLMMHELDEQAQRLTNEREALKKEILKKHAGESAELEESRIRRQYERMQQIYCRIESITDEKLEIAEKLFMIQQNFIRKLDQQIQKSEEDKDFQRMCANDEDADLAFSYAKFNGSKKNKIKGAGGLAQGQSSFFGKDTGFGSLNAGGIGGRDTGFGIGGKGDMMGSLGTGLDSLALSGPGASKKNKGNDMSLFGSSRTQIGDSLGGKLEPSSFLGPTGGARPSNKRDKGKNKSIIRSQFDPSGGPQFSMMSSTQSTAPQFGVPMSKKGAQASQFQPYSQDNSQPENIEEEDSCSICNEKRQDAWIACDTCDRWFHYGCVGITQDNAPKQNEQYHCPGCLQNGSAGAAQAALKRGFSEVPADIFNE